ncbi:MAG: MMPL family transporter, partial [Planctomycetaceae bacterium]|nr:MMPL family transporter [Planctomycetaceae bacterium]
MSVPRSFDRFFGSTVDHPWVVVSIIVLLTGISVIGHLGPESVWETVSPVFFSTSSTPAEPLPEPVESGTSEDRVTTQVDPVSVTDSDTILVIRSDDFFTPSGAEALREIVAALEELEYVDDVFWMDTVPVLNIFGLRESLFPRATASPRQFEMARRNALKHPLVRGQLLSDDGRTLLMMIRFDWLFVESDEAVTTEIRETANRITARFPEVSFETMITGRVPIYLTYMKAQETNRRFFQMVGYSTVALLAIILFRGIRAVMIVGLAPVLGVLWTMGMLRYFDVRDNPFNDIVLPILLALVGLTDGVHLMVEIRKLRASGLGEKAAARAGIRKVGFACFLTSLTTAIGFGSLSLAHHQVIQEFGWSCVLGVILTFVAVITAIPLACSTWLGRNIHVGLERGLIDRHLHRISGIIQVSLHSPRIMSLAAILITAGLVAVSLTLRPDEHQANALPAKSEAYRAIKHMDLAMGGLEPGFVTIRWDDKIRQNPGMILKVITIADEILEREELIGHPLSLADFLKALPGEGTYEQRMSLAE